MNGEFNWHNYFLRNPVKLSFCEILNSHFNIGLCKDSTYVVSIIEKLKGTAWTDKNAMDASSTSARKAREVYWMFPYCRNDRAGDEAKTAETHFKVGTKFWVLLRKSRRIRRGISYNSFSKIKTKQFINEVKNMLETNSTKAPSFIRISLVSMKKYSLKYAHQLLNDLLSTESSIFLCKQNFHQSFDIIECKLYKPKPPKCKRKPSENICNICFHNKCVEFIRLASIFRDQVIVSSFPTTPKTFSTPMVTCELD